MEAGHEVCDALRFLVKARIVDYNGHASVRVPQGFLINTAASNRAAPAPDQLCAVSLDGELLEGGRPPNEAHLHAAIYRARPDIRAVAHGHPRWLCTLSAAGARLAPVMPQAAVLGELPVYPHGHSISTRERGEAVAALMGSAPAIVLRGHGIVTAGPELLAACVLALYAEQTAERQVLAAPLGGARPLPADELEEYARTLANPVLFRKCWDFTLSTEN
jgi:L-fuculose-phosphate aldolase